MCGKKGRNIMSKCLVVYFSRAGEQYTVGEIQEGNTAIVAKIIAKEISADTFEIKVLDDSYPDKYAQLIQCAKMEKKLNARPVLEGEIENINQYDTIFLGYPNWWGDMPMAVYSFIEKYDVMDKKVYHFCTHEGSGGVNKDGFAVYGHVAQNDRHEVEADVKEWLKKIGF